MVTPFGVRSHPERSEGSRSSRSRDLCKDSLPAPLWMPASRQSPPELTLYQDDHDPSPIGSGRQIATGAAGRGQARVKAASDLRPTQGFPHPVRRERHLSDPGTRRVEDRVRDRRRNRQTSPLRQRRPTAGPDDRSARCRSRPESPGTEGSDSPFQSRPVPASVEPHRLLERPADRLNDVALDLVAQAVGVHDQPAVVCDAHATHRTIPCPGLTSTSTTAATYASVRSYCT